MRLLVRRLAAFGTPLLFLLGALVYSLAFNVAWAWGTGHLSVAAAAACTLIVPAGLHLWPQIPAHSRPRRFFRGLVMLGICVAAAVTSFVHAVHVLLSAGWDPWTACSVTGGAELLVALSTMALRTPADHAVQAADPVADPQPETPADTPRTPVPATPVPAEPVDEPAPDLPADPPVHRAPSRPRQLSAVGDDRAARFAALVAETGGVPTESQVRKRLGCRQTVAQRLIAEYEAGPRDDEVERVG